MGLALYSVRHIEQSISFLKKAIQLSPKIAKYHYDLGFVLQSSGQSSASIEHYRASIDLAPTSKAALENLGVALFETGQNEAAISAFDKALKIDSKSMISLSNLSTLKRWQGESSEALLLLKKACEIDPLVPEIRMKRSGIFISRGEFDKGWSEFSWRFLKAGIKPQDPILFVPIPRWDGQDISGKKLLVYAEQGVGDEVMFASCLPDLMKKVSDCHLLCDPRLVPVFSRSFPHLPVSASRQKGWADLVEGIGADYRIALGDLPRLFRKSEDSFGKLGPYLQADESLSNYWNDRLQSFGKKIKVGLSWRGGADRHMKMARSIDLSMCAPLLEMKDVVFVNLQYGETEGEIELLPEKVKKNLFSFNEIDPLTDLESFFSLLENLDLVISVDNSTVHFAGALGISTKVLLPALPEGRWPLEGEYSRWYHSVQLIRQSPEDGGSWGRVLGVAQKIIQDEVSTPRRIPLLSRSTKAAVQNAATVSPSAGKRKALLLNDTSYSHHYGCACSSFAVRSRLRGRFDIKGAQFSELRKLPAVVPDINLWTAEYLEQFVQKVPAFFHLFGQSDVVIINGEGCLHGRSPYVLNLLYLAYSAKNHFGKSVYIINHSCYPEDQEVLVNTKIEDLYRQVYSVLDGIAVREPISRHLLAGMGLNATESFDCLPLFVEEYRSDLPDSEPVELLIGGSVAWDQNLLNLLTQLIDRTDGKKCTFLYGANALPAEDDRRAFLQLKTALPGQVELFCAKSELEWLSKIASAEILISGRFHHSIAAACLETPFIVLDSNTPKIKGMMQEVGMDSHISLKDPNCTERVLSLFEAFRQEPEKGIMPKENYARILALAEKNFEVFK